MMQSLEDQKSALRTQLEDAKASLTLQDMQLGEVVCARLLYAMKVAVLPSPYMAGVGTRSTKASCWRLVI